MSVLKQHWFAGVAVLLALALAAMVVPAARVPVILAVAVLAAASPVVGMVLHRPADRLPWIAVAAMLSSLAAALVLTEVLGDDAPAACRSVAAGQAVAIGVQGCMILARHRRGDGARRRAQRHGSGDAVPRAVDTAVLALALGVTLAQAVVTVVELPAGARWWIAVCPPLDLLLACLTLRLIASRQQMGLSGRLAGIASFIGILYDLAITASGHRVLAPGAPVVACTTVFFALFVLADVHPSMRTAYAPQTLSTMRSESARLVGMLPLAAVPLGLELLGAGVDQQRLPVLVYLVSGVALAALVVWRGARAVRESEFHADHDALTGLANRRGLARAFAAHQGARRTLCVVDVDDFKQVNDTVGPQVGDSLLRQVSDRLRSRVGEGRVARTGGDQFVLLLDAGEGEAAAVLADAFGDPFDAGGRPHHLGASLGSAALEPGWSLEHVLADAEVALAAAKDAPGSSVAYDPALREAVLGRAALVAELQQALDGDAAAGALEVHHQPLVDLATREVVGSEALVRWRHPERGLVPPDTFLPLAELHGLGARIDAWVLDRALEQLRAWDAAGPRRLHVSVNLGRSSMIAPGLADLVLGALDAAGVSPDRLHLEITEHDELPAGAGAADLAALVGCGVAVSLDDFGIGYTSLDYLRQYPIGCVKLDRSLTASLQSEDSSPLLVGIVALTRALGVDLLGEGIETEEQQARLTALGVTFGQGYHLGRPVPGPQTLGWSQEAGAAVERVTRIELA